MTLIATRMQNWRLANPELDRNMARPMEYGALDFFIQQTNAANSIINDNLRTRAFESMGNTVQVPVINYDGDVVVSNQRSCVIGDDENTSALFTLSWVTLSVGFTMVPQLYRNNEISYEQDFARKMEKISRAMANEMDILGVAALEANKTQVYKEKLYYQVEGNTVQVPWLARMDFLGDLNAMMRANSYPGTIHIVGNAGIDALMLRIAQHGIYNDENKQNEFAGKIFHYTNNVENEDGKFATAYAVVDGNVGVITRVDREALNRTKANNHEWDVVNLPFIDLPVGAHYYTSVGDNSGIAGEASADMNCSVKEHFGFSVDVAFIVAYNSDAEHIANPIIKVEVATSGSANAFATPVEVVNSEENPVNTKAITEE